MAPELRLRYILTGPMAEGFNDVGFEVQGYYRYGFLKCIVTSRRFRVSGLAFQLVSRGGRGHRS